MKLKKLFKRTIADGFGALFEFAFIFRTLYTQIRLKVENQQQDGLRDRVATHSNQNAHINIEKSSYA